MSAPQAAIGIILLAAMAMFVWGRWRHDMVALGALLAAVAAGVVPADAAFAGFGHPAVITVACVLVLSRGLQASGAVDLLAARVLPREAGAVVSIAALSLLAALLSAVMNNVGALALLMPLALQLARRKELPPGQVLMPLAFSSILGGMTTLIGTPPNLIVSAFRQAHGGTGFGMFAFTPVGLAVAASGVVFVALAARLLVPVREQAGLAGFDTEAYLTEVTVPEGARAEGMTLAAVEEALPDIAVIGFIRHEIRRAVPHPTIVLRAGDILQVEAEADALAAAMGELGLVLEEAVGEEEAGADGASEKERDNDKGKEKRARQEGPALIELVVLPGARLSGRSATDISLRTRYGVNLLALSRGGRRIVARLRDIDLAPGDVLLMQGDVAAIAGFAADHGCAPLAERSLAIPNRRRLAQAVMLMLGAIALSASGLAPAAVAFAAGVLGAMALNVVPPRSVYTAIDWPVVVLLGALLPVAGAVAETGLAAAVAGAALAGMPEGDALVALAVVLVTTMTLSDLVNNAATAAVMCPIAASTAASLGVSADPFLMAVAVGASCAFLTPIGHQNNTLILGPGGFRFGDYWRLGLPLELIVVAVAVPLLPRVWPF